MHNFLNPCWLLATFLVWVNAGQAENSVYAGIANSTLIDSGVMVVEHDGGFARTEVFEFVKRSDGGVTLLNTIHAKDGRYRVRGRFDYDAQWRSTKASGIGLYDGVAVNIGLETRGDTVTISVEGEGVVLNPMASCDPDCLLNMSPSALAMFTMTRLYDRDKGGEQLFRWAGQDLDRVRTLSGGTARLTYQGQMSIPRGAGSSMAILHYTFVETFPTANGGTFSLNFDLWTDDQERPMGFQVVSPGAAPPGVVGFRQGFDDVRDGLVGSKP